MKILKQLNVDYNNYNNSIIDENMRSMISNPIDRVMEYINSNRLPITTF